MSRFSWAVDEAGLRNLATAVLPELRNLVGSDADAEVLAAELTWALSLPAGGRAVHALETALARQPAVRGWLTRQLRRSPGVRGARPTTAEPWAKEPGTEEPGAEEPPGHRAYARVDAPPVVVVGERFEVTVGLSPSRDRTLLGTGPFDLPEDPPAGTALDVLITVDPGSLRLDADARLALHVTPADPYPSRTVTMTALDGEDVTDQRRIGVHYLRDGAVVAIAWRMLVAVATPEERTSARRPPAPESQLLDLGVLAADPPDLVLVVYRADSTVAGRYVWDVYPSAPGVPVPDTQRAADIGDPKSMPGLIGQEAATSADPFALYTYLEGTGRQIGDKIPQAIQKVIATVAENPSLTQAAAVLLLTEEPYVPWELAVMTPRLHTGFGGDSPFLGAHVAIGRWPLTTTRPKPVPPRSVQIRDRAVLTARYEGVVGWPRLPHAEDEAVALAARYRDMAVIDPLFRPVLDCLRGSPPADVLHVALHGQVNAQGRDGLVLLAPKSSGGYGPQFLKPPHVHAVEMPRQTFVFLNACQVGQGSEVLGDYAGLAVAFLAAGAAGVVAAMWNVDDAVAAEFAAQFYAAVDEPAGVSVGEALRRARAGYTPDQGGQSSATFVAYQLFGHPRLRLTTHDGGQHG
jgi:CHAT domain